MTYELELVRTHGMDLVITSDALAIPITLTEVKDHVNVDFADEDNKLTALLGSAFREVELFIEKGLKTKTVVYYESRYRELKKRRKNEYRCDERLKTKIEESTLLGHTGLVVELEHLKTKTRLIDKKFASVRGEFVYYESIKRCYERLQTKTKEFTRLAYTGLVVELEHLSSKDRDEVNSRDVSECDG